jgi:uncharacterized OB-fold protein
MATTDVRKRAPAVEGLFTWPSDAPRLIAGHCMGCGTYSFPYYATCINPDCRDRRVEKATLSGKGTLWTYTVHYYRPPPPFVCPEPFTPFAIGVVELPEGLKVMGMVTGCDPESLQIGAAMQLVIDTLETDAAGTELLTWKFAPCEEPSHA